MTRPTCVVSPQPSVPTKRGLTGLNNIGNTCFMNSVLQVLVNTAPLREYFLSSQFQQDLNNDNPLGSGGRLAIQFALLNKILWAGDRSSHSPGTLKKLVAEKASQFTGFAQHDSQEFLAFLLDGLHEDLNRIRKKPYITETPLDNLPNIEAAAIAWQRYKSRNDSFIVDEFQGQYRSELVCLVCKKISVTFDPYMYISVPIPKPKIKVSIIVFPLNGTKSPYQLTLSVTQGARVKDIRDELLNVTNCRPRSFIFMQPKDGKPEVLDESWKTNSYLFDDKSDIYAFEVETSDSVGHEVVTVFCTQRILESHKPCSFCEKPAGDLSFQRCLVCHMAHYCSKDCQKSHWPEHKERCRKILPEVIGQPFVVSLPKSELTYQKLANAVESCARYSVNFFRVPANLEHHSAAGDGVSHPDVNKPKGCLFYMGLINKYGVRMMNGKPSPRLNSKSTNVLDLPDQSYLAVDWNPKKDKLGVSSKDLEYVKEEPEGKDSDIFTANDTGVERCLHQFTIPETLSKEEAWYCPNCKTHRDASKQMSLWSLPDTLIIQLKRFSFGSSYWRSKITDYISFPLTGLDLTRFYVGPQLPQIPLYDLYGVVNHHGTLLGGHYTAYARCLDQYDSTLTETGWRLMDDSHVSYIENEKEVLTSAAYMLFYKRRIPTAGSKYMERRGTSGLPADTLRVPADTPIAPADTIKTKHKMSERIEDLQYVQLEKCRRSDSSVSTDMDSVGEDFEDINLIANSKKVEPEELEEYGIDTEAIEINDYRTSELDRKLVNSVGGEESDFSSASEREIGASFEYSEIDAILDYTDMDAVD